ncbi:hypothetical protein [Streptomyces flaveus]|uniref:Uncharacterized protein n=1 Tax=Streptomyces flaveus TaxID=66370 RepID=A0A917R2B8_9ACTN|nr:hypothetical protein [Streptomyces flaveus]GGK85486.1 hypothetical protein GCM10010094_53410 [Streptomyces flaveus]
MNSVQHVEELLARAERTAGLGAFVTLAADPASAEPPPARDVTLTVPEHHFTEPLHAHTAAVWGHSLDVLRRAGIRLVPAPR